MRCGAPSHQRSCAAGLFLEWPVPTLVLRSLLPRAETAKFDCWLCWLKAQHESLAENAQRFLHPRQFGWMTWIEQSTDFLFIYPKHPRQVCFGNRCLPYRQIERGLCA
jgi:hypothetical protein